MAFGTATIAFTPGYNTIGLLAPLMVVAGRLVQGFSAGVELGGVSVYLAEIATPGNKGFYCSWQSASQQVAVIFASLVGVSLNYLIPAEQMLAWGWRIPLLIGCLIIPLILVLRRSLKETEEFEKRKRHPTGAEVLRLIAGNISVVLLGVLLSTLTTTTFYLITAYTPTFGKQVLGFVERDNLIVTLCVGFSNLFWLPIGGAISDQDRPPPDARGARRGGAALRVSCDELANVAASFARLLIVATVVLVHLRNLQRGADSLLDRDDAAAGPHLRLLAGVQPGHRTVRRAHAGDLHLPDPCHRQSSHARGLAQRRGHTGSLRIVGFEAIHHASAGGGASHSLDHVQQDRTCNQESVREEDGPS